VLSAASECRFAGDETAPCGASQGMSYRRADMADRG